MSTIAWSSLAPRLSRCSLNFETQERYLGWQVDEETDELSVIIEDVYGFRWNSLLDLETADYRFEDLKNLLKIMWILVNCLNNLVNSFIKKESLLKFEPEMGWGFDGLFAIIVKTKKLNERSVFMERSMYAGRVRSEHIGTTITLKGWVSRRRNLGGFNFYRSS